MYGLILDGVIKTLISHFGEDKWEEIQRHCNTHYAGFNAQKKYSETIVNRITKAAVEVTGMPTKDIMNLYGEYFVKYVATRGYAPILRVLGRNMRDFLNGLDNLHEYLRFSYPSMKPPSFFCEKETRNGLILHYRSRRKGYLHYVMGQIHQVGMDYYNTEVHIEIINEEETMGLTHVIMALHFDNVAFQQGDSGLDDLANSLSLCSEVFFDVFPFHIVYNQSMIINSIGSGLAAVMPECMNQPLDEVFMLMRPLVDLNVENVLMYSNNVFLLTSINPIAAKTTEDNRLTMANTEEEFSTRHIRLKGQMLYMKEWGAIIFLGTPIMENLERMFEAGLYINDLSMHDCSRDLVLAGTQQSAELKMALDQEQQKSKKLEESMKKLDFEMKRTDSLLYQMIPKTVADRLRKGEAAVNTCEVFDQVTILFSDVVGFTQICSQITPMAVVSMLNAMYTKFDMLSEKHRVYKVETIGDAYMVVSGAPTITRFHALYIADMAFDMLDSMADLIDPATGKSMRIRVAGIHSGTVVAGVVGVKMPRYCLFGDTVNIASKMENNGEAMKIHISALTKEQLEAFPYMIEKRDSVIEIKVSHNVFNS
ncbi:hypothetical protein CAPTEDRAFT_91580 [Capitella teleta]|uniref:guanylate cyclase n=1 Tax=Capitella teleta TaxID=283909 RepID=R7TQT5_CAPTE|nr:hypothetical protein CAPTEDRAFT_91580 [Capitella teleta]|eukprot:ELT93390.1 hypothetical protein CAPTEDRAFT_91580 [Capitella teleta]